MTGIIHFSFHQPAIIKYNLNSDDLVFLEWLKGFFLYKNIQVIEHDKVTYYWVKYTKILEDLPFIFKNIYNVRRTIKKLSDPSKQSPLIQRVVFSQKGAETYFAFNAEVMHELEGKTDMYTMTSMMTDKPMRNKKIRGKDYQKVPCHKEVLDIFNKLKTIKENGNALFTDHEPPYDKHHYTNLFRNFQNDMFALYEGKFLTKYKMDTLSKWFLDKYSYYLDKDAIIKKVKKCKGKWDEVKSLMIQAAKNYAHWFDANTEQMNKEVLPRSVQEWLYAPHTQTSMFYVCLLEGPSMAREATADKIFNSIEPKYRSIVWKLYKNEFDGFTFWNKIKKVINWYNTNAKILQQKDSNCAYWLDQGCSDFLMDYCNWLYDLTNGHPFIKNIGTGNPTFDLYIQTKIKEHGITTKVPRS